MFIMDYSIDPHLLFFPQSAVGIMRSTVDINRDAFGVGTKGKVESEKVDSFPVWLIILLSSLGLLIVGGIGYYIAKKRKIN